MAFGGGSLTMFAMSGGPASLMHNMGVELEASAFKWMAIYGILLIVMLIGVFLWKKWGFYGFVTIASINILANMLLLGADFISGLIGGAIAVGIAYCVINPYLDVRIRRTSILDTVCL